jgi:hypothetical protein
MTIEMMQEELARMTLEFESRKRYANDESAVIDWGLWAEVCREAAQDLKLLEPASPTCPQCGKQFWTECQCDPPF